MAIIYLLILCTIILFFSSKAIVQYDKPVSPRNMEDAYSYLFDVYREKR